jgi:hypothetical protein
LPNYLSNQEWTMSQSAITRVVPSIRHLDGCENIAASVPCFTHPGGSCDAAITLGTIADVCDEPASIMTVRTIDEDGADAYLNVYGGDFTLSLSPEQARRMAALLVAGADLVELNREHDAAVHAAWASR